MFGYSPHGAYSSPYGRVSPSYDADYLRALAQERAAQEQLLSARRAQEEARQRSERARLAQSRYGLPSRYIPLYDNLDDSEEHDSYDSGYTPYGFGGYAPTSRQRQAALAQERQRALQMELERRERERDERLRLEEEKRQLEEERKRLIEEERRQRIRAEQLRRREQEYNRQRTRQFNPLFGPYGWIPDEEEETVSPRTGRRLQTGAPGHLRGMTSQGNPAGVSRSSSVPPRSAFPPNSIRSSASGSKAETGHFRVPIRTPSPKQKAPSPKLQEPQGTPEQHDAARKIQEAYRAHTARALALRTIDSHRTKFAHLKAGFRFPSSIDFATGPSSHDHVSVPVDPAALAALVLADGVSVEEGRSRRPQLAYTSQNAPVHAYLEELNRLLSALDAVESGGDKEVRERRKGIVREVEAEAERVEAVVGEVWSRWQMQQESRGSQQAEAAAEVAPGTQQETIEQPDQDAQTEPHLDQQPPSQLMQTEETTRVAQGMYEAVAEQQHAGDAAHLDIIPHVERMPTEETTQLVSSSQTGAGESSTEADGWVDSHAEDGDQMQVEPSESAPPVDAPAVPMDTDADQLAVASAPPPEIDIPDAEPGNEEGYEEVAGKRGGVPIPREVEAPPTPEIDIKDADEEEEAAAHSPTEPPQSPAEPVNVHPQPSAVVDEPLSPSKQPEPEVQHLESSLMAVDDSR